LNHWPEEFLGEIFSFNIKSPPDDPLHKDHKERNYHLLAGPKHGDGNLNQVDVVNGDMSYVAVERSDGKRLSSNGKSVLHQ